MKQWFNWLTFDIIGDLAFGDLFGAVENAKGHPWITTVKESLHASMFVDMFRRVPLLKLWPSLIRPEGLVEQREEHFRLSREKAERRMKMGNEREDFFAHFLSEKASDLSVESLTGQANTMVIAGSEIPLEKSVDSHSSIRCYRRRTAIVSSGGYWSTTPKSRCRS